MIQDDSPVQGLNRKDRSWEFHLYDYRDRTCLWLLIAKSMTLQVKEGNYSF